MEINNNDGKAKILAYYLPQFYPTEFNNKWYGKGFTEWTNVGKAKPLFHGHYQPHIPSELGYYDMRVPEIAIQQAQLAREAGVFGFCYWHYWFGGGNQLLTMPSERLLKTGKPDFPFCFAWANENWYKKLWDKDTSKDTLIMEQLYEGEEDNKRHFEYCLPFFKDPRYIRYNNRPIFYIYKPLLFKGVQDFIKQWNRLIKESGIADSFYFVGMIQKNNQYQRLKDLGFDCITPQHGCRMGEDTSNLLNHIRVRTQQICNNILGIPKMIDYNKCIKFGWNEKLDSQEDIAPQLIPNWDNTPRASRRGWILKNSTPKNWSKAAQIVLKGVEKKKNKLVFLKSWNEWAEGNYMEPDLKYGKGYIQALGKLVNEIKSK